MPLMYVSKLGYLVYVLLTQHDAWMVRRVVPCEPQNIRHWLDHTINSYTFYTRMPSLLSTYKAHKAQKRGCHTIWERAFKL